MARAVYKMRFGGDVVCINVSNLRFLSLTKMDFHAPQVPIKLEESCAIFRIGTSPRRRFDRSAIIRDLTQRT